MLLSHSLRMATMCVLLGCTPLIYAQSSDDSTTASSASNQALVILSTLDMPSFHEAIAFVRDRGGEVPLDFPPNAFIVTLNPRVERALDRLSTVSWIERDVVDPETFANFGGQAQDAARAWNTVFLGIPDPDAPSVLHILPPLELNEPSIFDPPPEQEDGQIELYIVPVAGAPAPVQTSEFMAGTIVYTVVFVESSGGTGFCSPADSQSENWSSSRQNTALTRISTGLGFWTSRKNRPNPLTFRQDKQGTRATSCEPITRPSTHQGRWIADVLTAMGFPATPSNYIDIARSFVDSRRMALGADWGFVIFVVDSQNDPDGSFSDGKSAFTTPYGPYPNGPYMVLTYDNGTATISRMNLVVAHETGHIFGSLDEAATNCLASDSSGYLNVVNTSCNNGGITNDISIMGEGSEITDSNVDVSTSARGAIGWRNPDPPTASIAIVDVVRTATAALTPYAPDPTTDRTPTYRAIAGNKPFPPGGCNIIGGICTRTPLEVNICTVKDAKWRIEGYSTFTHNSLKPDDGAWGEVEEAYTFTPSAQLQPKTYTFSTYSINNFGHSSAIKSDTLTIK
jgi:hypothetical protein